jgi:hypothetical protein
MFSPIGRLLFAVYILILTGIFLTTGDRILGLLIIVTIAVHLAGMYACRHPHSAFAWTVFRRKFGPDTETKYMTRKELLQSGVRFFLLSLYPFLTMVGLGVMKEELTPLLSETITLAIYFACSIFFIACVAGGIYLMIRGLLRSSDFVPEGSDAE